MNKKIRVLQLLDSLHAGGAEVLAVNIANALSNEGVESHLCVTRNEGPLKEYIEPAVQYLFLKRKNEVWNYIPSIERTIKLPPSMMMQNWMGTDFTNDDVVQRSSIVEDYSHKIINEEVDEYHEKLDGGFVKPSDDSKK